MNNKIIGGLVIAILVVGGIWYVASNKQEAPLETTKIKFAYLPVIQNLPLYVAIEKGYFKDATIEIESIKFEAPNQIIDAVMTGQVDFASGALGIAAIADFKNPDKLQVYAVGGGTKGNSGVHFIVPVNSTLVSLIDLKGKKLGILAGSIQWRTIAREILEKNGLNPEKDLIIVELAPSVQIEALASGQIDALLAHEPTPATAVHKGVAKIWIADPTVTYLSDPFYTAANIVGTEFAKTNPNTTQKVIDIIEKTIKEIEEDPSAYRQYLAGYTPLSEELILLMPPVDFKMCEALTTKDKDSIQKFFDIFTKHKVVEGQISVDGVLYCK